MKYRIRRSGTLVRSGAGEGAEARPEGAAVPMPRAGRTGGLAVSGAPGSGQKPAADVATAAGPAAAPAGAGKASGKAAGFDPESAFSHEDDGFGPAPFATARGNANIADPAEVSAEEELDAIRREGLTGRQLRMARRVAQKHGLAVTSDFDAIRQLRKQGIDPFERGSMLELVISDGKSAAAPGTSLTPAMPQTLPQTVPAPKPPGPHVPPAQKQSEEMRARDIQRIQRDIARRRRRKLALLFVRLAVFVLLPTLLAGIYYYRIATPLYATKSEFLIQKADGGGSSLGGLFAGTQFAASQDSIAVQSYLTSRDAMLRLDAEQGYKAHFSQEWIDPVRRLPEGASNEEAFRLYNQNIRIGFDPTEGIVRMEVVAADSQSSERFALALIGYAEEQVDHLSARMRGGQMEGAQASFEDAERKMIGAQARVLELQEKLGVLDPTAESGALMSQIASFETELRQKSLELQALLDNAQPNQARVDGVRGDISRLQAMVSDLRGQLTQSVGETASLARITGELRMAEVDLETRRAMMTAALEQLEAARIEANKQVRYLAIGVRPVAPDEATYPRKFENTLLAFLIFSGIYLMISLTASILREQVSA